MLRERCGSGHRGAPAGREGGRRARVRQLRLFSLRVRSGGELGRLQFHNTASLDPAPPAGRAPSRRPSSKSRPSQRLVRVQRQMPAHADARCRRRRAFLLLVAGYICVAAAPLAADARSASNRPSSRREGTVEAPSSAFSPRRVEEAAGAAPPGPRAPRPLAKRGQCAKFQFAKSEFKISELLSTPYSVL